MQSADLARSFRVWAGRESPMATGWLGSDPVMDSYNDNDLFLTLIHVSSGMKSCSHPCPWRCVSLLLFQGKWQKLHCWTVTQCTQCPAPDLLLWQRAHAKSQLPSFFTENQQEWSLFALHDMNPDSSRLTWSPDLYFNHFKAIQYLCCVST